MTTTEVSSRRRQTRDRLIEAASELFATHSVEGTSVEELCERAGFTRGAFYSNFGSMEELCIEMVRRRGEQMLQITDRALAMIPDAPVGAGRLDEIIAKVVAVLDVGFSLDERWVIVRNELRLYAYRTPSVRPAMVAAEHSTVALAMDALSAALDRQGAGLRIPIEQLMVTVESYCDHTQLDAVLSGNPDDHAWREGLERLLSAVVVLPG